MSAAEVDAVLERLVAQFESPYDFLRELVQNAMDAGSDRVEVTLETHPADPDGGGDEVVFELMVMDTGAGMDEAILEGELTRLFSTGKAGDRTTAGGFGIGFVSVFAWEPEAVLLQTGRAGEAWELSFRSDRTFDKYRLDQPVEGTTVMLFRRGRAGERESVAEAIRDALWRWCRYCPLEITFEDIERGEPPELIQDSPEPPEDALSRRDVQGDSHVRVTFGVPSAATLLRHGLILAEGSPRQLLPDIAEQLGRSHHHLRVWADSPLLRTTMARDKVVDDEGRKKIERRVLALRDALCKDLQARLEELASEGGAWTAARHRRYANYHAHLGLELIDEDGKLADALVRRRFLRVARSDRGWSLLSVIEWLEGRPLLVSAADLDAPEERALVDQAVAAGVPVLAADLDEDRTWLGDLARARGLTLLPVRDGLSRIEERGREAAGLCGLVEKLLQGAGLRRTRVKLGHFVDVEAVDPPVFGVHEGSEKRPLACFGGPQIPANLTRDRVLWLNRDQVLVQATMRSFSTAPLAAGMSLALAMLGRMGGDAPDPSDLADVAEDLRPSST